MAAVAASGLFASLRPRHWPRTVRNVFARQLLFTAAQGVRFVAMVATLVGITVVVETYRWLDKVGLSENTGALLVMLVGRELGPLFVNFIVIVRSGGAMASELAVMKVSGEVRTLEAQEVEPLLYLVMPRVLAMVAATFSLTAIFNVIAFASGYGFGVFIQVTPLYESAVCDITFALAPGDLLPVLMDPEHVRRPLADAAQGLVRLLQGRVRFLGRDWQNLPADTARRCAGRHATSWFIRLTLVCLLSALAAAPVRAGPWRGWPPTTPNWRD